MNSNFIKTAYSHLNPSERDAVNTFVLATRIYAERNNEQIIHALSRPIPSDVIARSRGELEKPLVLAAIHEQIMQLADEQDLSGKRVLREHINIATANMMDYLAFKTFTHPVTGEVVELPPEVNLKNCTRAQMAAVKSVKISKGLYGISVNIELHSKQTSLDTLSKMMGLDQPDNPIYMQQVKHTRNTKPITKTMSVAEAEKRYVALLEGVK